MILADAVIKFIEDNYGKKFPTSLMMETKQALVKPIQEKHPILIYNFYPILAGGSIANAILSMQTGKFYPVRDFDVYILKRDNDEYYSYEQNQPVQMLEANPPDEYAVIRDNHLYMVGREQKEDDVDIVIMRPAKSLAGLHPIDITTNLLNTFDLNCVKAAIVYNPDTELLEVVLSDDFVRFLETRQVEIVNVHTLNTLGRALKKAKELDGYVNMEEELKVIHNSCNIDNLKDPTDEQLNKISDFKEEYDDYVTKLKELGKSNPELWEIYAGTEIQGLRYIKNKIARVYLKSTFSDGTKQRLKDILYVSGVEIPSLKLITLGAVYKHGLVKWLGTKNHSKERLATLENYLVHHSRLESIYLRKNLDEMFARYDFFKSYERRYGMDLISALEKVAEQHGKDKLSSTRTSVSELSDRELLIKALQQVRVIRKENVKDKVSFFLESGKTFPDFIGEDIIIKELDSDYLLKEEGRRMKHCVGGYGYLVREGKSRIFHCLIPSTGEESTLDVQVGVSGLIGNDMIMNNGEQVVWSRLKVRQLRGKCNVSVSEKMSVAAHQWVKLLGTYPDLSYYLVLPKKDLYTLVG